MFKSTRVAAGGAAAILQAFGAPPLRAQPVAPSGGSSNFATALVADFSYDYQDFLFTPAAPK